MINKQHFIEMLSERLSELSRSFRSTPEYRIAKNDFEPALENLEEFKKFMPEEQRKNFQSAINKFVDAYGSKEGEFTVYCQAESFKDGFHFSGTIE